MEFQQKIRRAGFKIVQILLNRHVHLKIQTDSNIRSWQTKGTKMAMNSEQNGQSDGGGACNQLDVAVLHSLAVKFGNCLISVLHLLHFFACSWHYWAPWREHFKDFLKIT